MTHKTDSQRAAAHLWFRECSQVLNDSGMERKLVIEALAERGIDMPWDARGEAFKELVYKPLLAVVTGKTSTEDESTTDPNLLYHGIVRWFGQEFGVTLPPFPDRFTQGLDDG